MMSHTRLLFVSAAGVIAAACASSPSESAPAAEAPITLTTAWTGSFQPTQERTGNLAPTRLQQASGTVRIRQSPRDPRRSAISLVVATSVQEPSSMRWAMLPGRCGSASLPLLGHDQFPPLEVSSSGRGQLDVDLPIELPQGGSYHVNVYGGGGTELEDVITCANLRRGS